LWQKIQIRADIVGHDFPPAAGAGGAVVAFSAAAAAD
jgi:hypothetical protein